MPTITSGSGDIPVLSEVFGSTPGTVLWDDIGLGAEQLKSIKANLAAFGDIEQLGGKYYDYMLGLMDRSIPGFQDILATGGDLTKRMMSTAGEFLAGQIPQDVIDQVTRSSAFQNLQSGLYGGAMGAANQARNLGLTSLDMISKGAGLFGQAGNAAQQWGNIAKGLIMDPSKFFITPQEQFEATTMNQIQRNAALQLEENKKAAPGAVAKGVSDTIINLIGAYLGAGRSGGPTAPNYNPAAAAGPGPSDVSNPGYYVNPGGGGEGGAPTQSFNMGVQSQAANYNPYITNPAGDVSGLGYGNVFNITGGGPTGYPGLYNNPPPNETMYPSPTWY